MDEIYYKGLINIGEKGLGAENFISRNISRIDISKGLYRVLVKIYDDTKKLVITLIQKSD